MNRNNRFLVVMRKMNLLLELTIICKVLFISNRPKAVTSYARSESLQHDISLLYLKRDKYRKYDTMQNIPQSIAFLIMKKAW